MTFSNATCEMCKKPLFGRDRLVAYRISGGASKVVRIEGEQPWSGIRVICVPCVEMLRAADYEQARKDDDHPF